MLKAYQQIRVVKDGSSLKLVPGNPVRSNQTLAVAASNNEPRRGRPETASMGSGFNNSVSLSTVNSSHVLLDTMLNDLVGDNDQAAIRYYKDIYEFDSVCGSCVDLMSTMPFSQFNLDGCEKESRRKVYESSVEALNFQTLFPEISVDYLVNGRFIATPIYKEAASKFVDLITWNPADCDVRAAPFLGADPMIHVKPTMEMVEFLSSDSEHFRKMRQSFSAEMIEALQNDMVELDPLTTIFVPRKTFSYNHKGSSFLRRVLPLYFLEKSLYRGTLVEVGRRQRSILHLPMGDDEWIPTPEEMQAAVALFQQADLDPLNAIVATRSGVSPNELRSPMDFFKYTDMTDITNSMKMRALGISESFLSGEATYASMEVSLSVFVENLRAFRDMVTQRVFYGKLFPLIAYTNNFLKKDSKLSEMAGSFRGVALKHKLNDATMFDMPSVHWHKALRPEADQSYLEVLSTMKEHGVPVGISMWAAAGGITPEQLLKNAQADKEFTAKLKSLVGDVAQEGSDVDELARVLSRYLKAPPRSVLNREFAHEYEGRTRTGKRKAILNQRAETQRRYDTLMRVVSNSTEDTHQKNLRDIQRRLGNVPNLYSGR